MDTRSHRKNVSKLSVPLQALGSKKTKVTKTKASEPNNDCSGDAVVVAPDDSGAATAWYNITSADIFRNRNNPRNGIDCFFSEASYNQIMGPGPSFKEQLLSQIARIKFEEKKRNEASQNKTNPKLLKQNNSTKDVQLSKGAKATQFPAILFVPAGELIDQGMKDILAGSCGSVDQSLNKNSETLDKEFENKISSSTLAVKTTALDQNLKNETVNNESVNQNVNDYVTVNSESMNQTVNNGVAENSGLQHGNVNNSMTVVNNVSTVSTNIKQDQLSNCELIVNFTSLSSSEISAEQKNINCMNLIEPALNKSHATDNVDTEDVKNVPIVFLPTDVSICDTVNESYTNRKLGDIKDNETTSVIVGKHSKSIKLEPEKNIDNSKPEISPTNVLESKIMSSASTSYFNSASSDIVHCEDVASSTSTLNTAVTPISLDTDTNNSNLLLQNSKQSESEHFKHGEIEQRSSVQQNLIDTAEVTNACRHYSENQPQDLSENLKPNITIDNTAVTAASEDHSSVITSQTDFICKEKNPLVLNIAEVPEKDIQAPLLNRDSTEDENVLSSPQEAQELCLIMASLSSDDDDDDDDGDEENFSESISSHARKHPHNEDAASNNMDATASLDNWPPPPTLVVVSDISNNVSALNPPLVDHDDGSYTSPPDIVNNQEGDFVKTKFQTETQNIEMLSDYQPLVHEEGLLDNSYENNANWQATLAPKWSEVDIPIFSVKEISPERKCMKPTTVKQEDGKLQKSSDKGDRSLPEISPVEDGTANQKTLQFRRSNLTREEHAMYLRLYNRYVTLFVQKGPPPILTELQCKEIASFEALQRRVQAEQAEFQNYLLQNAKKNPQSYTFLRTGPRNYATCRAKSYRVKLKCSTKYKQNFDCRIPFCVEVSPAVLQFQQALLEVGLPPRIKLPDYCKKPVPMQFDIRKIDVSFPRFSKKSIPGFTHHEPVSYDMNVKTLATKYNFQVVMSSSVVKCLLNNHGPEFDRAWNIPVHVTIHDIDGENRTIVYLDKPLFEDDFHVKDYSSLFHKYALRTFLSHPRSQAAPVAKRLFNQAIHTEEAPCEIDDPFDLSSSNVDNLETFGAGCSKVFIKEKTLTENAKKDVKSVVAEHKVEETVHKLYGRNLRSKRKYTNWDEVSDDVSELEVKKSCNNFNNIQSTFKKGHQRKSGETENSTDLKLKIDNLVSDCEPAKKHSKTDQVDKSQDREKIICTRSSSVIKENCLSVNTDDSPQSPEVDCTDPFNTTQSPLSPIASPASPCAMNQNTSSKFIIQQIPLSPVREIPTSPVTQSPPSTLPSESFLTSPTAAIFQPCRRSPRIRTNSAESPRAAASAAQKANSVSKISRPSGGTQSKLFTPLDSILGPSFGRPEVKDSPDIPKEDPSHYLPPTGVHSSIVYNLWSLGALNILIRTRCHGVLKDTKKTRKVYFSPKMEYQSAHGLEQVTLGEMAKEWVACFIRPNTNLLRVRVNAFTSDILMFEELEPNKILRPSLNYKPESGFQFLDSVLQSLVILQPGYYLLSHEPGDNFCGIRSLKNKSDSEQANEKAPPMKKKKAAKENQLPWIPIDPTLLLPYHIANNRIPATFLPKDLILKRNNSEGANKGNTKDNAQNNGTDNKTGGFWKKFKMDKRKNKKF